MRSESATIRRAFFITFGVAVAFEVVSLALPWSGWIQTTDSPVAEIWFGVQYLPVAAFGFLIGRVRRPYRLAFAGTWIFGLLWFIVGYFTIWFGAASDNFTSVDFGRAGWGYVFATILFLPIAFAASAFGVWLSRVAEQIRRRRANAA